MIPQTVTLMTTNPLEQLKTIEYAGRNCYRSQDKITDTSYDGFIRRLIKRGHEAPLEFGHMVVELVTSRAVLAEITRHRLASYCVESQRYVDASSTGDISFIAPAWYAQDAKSGLWFNSMFSAEASYQKLRDLGATPQEAREVLPNSTACHIVMSANLREWRAIFKLRTSPAAYPQMREIMLELLKKADEQFPCVFDDLMEEEHE